MAVVASEDVHMVLVDHSRVGMAGAWPRLRIQRLHQVPRSALNAVAMEIVNPVVPVVAPKDVYAPVVHNCGVPVPWGGWLRVAVGGELAPRVGLEVEAVEVVTPVCAVVASKNVEVVLESHGGMQRAGTGWVYLVARGRLDLVPGVGLLEEVHVGASDDARTIEELLVEADAGGVRGLVEVAAHHFRNRN